VLLLQKDLATEIAENTKETAESEEVKPPTEKRSRQQEKQIRLWNTKVVTTLNWNTKQGLIRRNESENYEMSVINI